MDWTPEAGITTFATLEGLMPGGIAIHDDRLFVAAFTTDGEHESGEAALFQAQAFGHPLAGD